MVLPLLVMLTVFGGMASSNASTLLNLLLPIFCLTIKKIITYLHQLTFLRRNFAMYSDSAEYYLKSALLITGLEPILDDTINIEKIHIVENWKKVQLAIKLKSDCNPTQARDALLAILDLFHKYHIEYIVVNEKIRNRITRIYVNEAEVYDRLGLVSYKFWHDCYYQQFSHELRNLINKQCWHRKFEKVFF